MVFQLLLPYSDSLRVERIGVRTPADARLFSSPCPYRMAVEPSQYAVPMVLCFIPRVKAVWAWR